MNNRKTICRLLCAIAVAGIAAAAHAQAGTGIDVSGMAQNSNNLRASGPLEAIGNKGAMNPVPGEPGGSTNVIAIPEPSTVLLSLGGMSVLGLVLARRRK